MSVKYLPELYEWKDYCKLIKLSTGINMSYIELGNPEKDPLILVHGYSDSSMMFRNIIPKMQDNFHIYAVDLRGHGYSDKPEQFAYTIQQYAEDVIAFADAVGIDTFYLAGHSMGSMTSQSIAFSYPKRVRKVALLSTFAGFKATPEEIREYVATFEDWAKNGIDERDFWPALDTFYDPEYPKYAKRLYATWPLRCYKAAWWGMELADNSGFLQYIECPVYLMWGTEDNLISAELQDEVKRLLPDAKLKMLEGRTHEILQECPIEIAEELNEFFR